MDTRFLNTLFTIVRLLYYDCKCAGLPPGHKQPSAKRMTKNDNWFRNRLYILKGNISVFLTPERHENSKYDCTGSVECSRRSPFVQAARIQYSCKNAITGVTLSRRAQDPVGHWRFRIANIAAKHVDIIIYYQY